MRNLLDRIACERTSSPPASRRTRWRKESKWKRCGADNGGWGARWGRGRRLRWQGLECIHRRGTVLQWLLNARNGVVFGARLYCGLRLNLVWIGTGFKMEGEVRRLRTLGRGSWWCSDIGVGMVRLRVRTMECLGSRSAVHFSCIVSYSLSLFRMKTTF